MPRAVTLLTDFGTADAYVGEMKGLILSQAPDVQLVDISHEIAPQDIEGARLAVARYWRRFPDGTVHVIVVDPGVGSPRAALAVESDGKMLVGPDNGVLSPALLMPDTRVVSLPVATGASSTFHGRDVFAPAAALLANGTPLDSLGAPFEHPVVRRTPEARRMDDGAIIGEVISVDRFGTLLTNLVAPRGGSVEIAGRALGPLARTYADAPNGAFVALVGSSGLVEIARRNGSAAELLAVARGAPVILRPPRA
ncbi:MAG: SAM hydrolase/SAM-dependent halogenase family protein [Gemmatimonadaceae bacterium]